MTQRLKGDQRWLNYIIGIVIGLVVGAAVAAYVVYNRQKPRTEANLRRGTAGSGADQEQR
jgi:uncharacterized membrane-anchored protein YhcB (DUF1043 family)